MIDEPKALTILFRCSDTSRTALKSAQLVELKDDGVRKGKFEGKLKLDERTSSQSDWREV